MPIATETAYTTKPADDIWHGVDYISVYTRAQALKDGVLVDGSAGDFADVSRQHYKHPIAMTAAVFNLIQTAVEHPRACNDYAGVWHDILWMSKRGITARPDASTVLFRVKITGTGQRSIYTLKMVCGPGDEAEPVLTLMFPHED